MTPTRGIDAVTSLATGTSNPFSNTTISTGTDVTIKIKCERADDQPGAFSNAALVQNLQTGFNNKENKNKFSNLIATRRADKDYSAATLQANLNQMVQDQFTNASGFLKR